MDRRTLLKGAAVAAVGAPLASLALPTSAYAESVVGGYDVAVCEQTTNQIFLHTVTPGTNWNASNRKWVWQPPVAMVNGYNTWIDLTEIRFRNTTAFGWVALTAASYGKVGMVNFGDDDTLLWSARPYGNPHAVERIPDVGAVVVASAQADTSYGGPGNHLRYPLYNPDGSPKVDSQGNQVYGEGFLTIYAPQPGHSDDPSTLTKVDEFSFNGAHGLWYDGTYLWALGTDWLIRYAWEGTALDFRLKDSGLRIPVSGGHSLDADYHQSDYLLLTDGSHVRRQYKPDTSGATPPEWIVTDRGVKSYSRVASGESLWLQARYVSNPEDFTGLPDSYGQWNTYVQFFDTAGNPAGKRDLSAYTGSAHIYKARVSSVAFS